MPYSTTQLAQAAGVGRETLRHYERRGLLPSPPRAANGYRRYPESALVTLRRIRHASALGFPLTAIAEMLALFGSSRATCGALAKRAREHRVGIEQRIEELTTMRDALLVLENACPADRPLIRCNASFPEPRGVSDAIAPAPLTVRRFGAARRTRSVAARRAARRV